MQRKPVGVAAIGAPKNPKRDTCAMPMAWNWCDLNERRDRYEVTFNRTCTGRIFIVCIVPPAHLNTAQANPDEAKPKGGWVERRLHASTPLFYSRGSVRLNRRS